MEIRKPPSAGSACEFSIPPLYMKRKEWGKLMASMSKVDQRMNDAWTLPNGLRIVGERLPYLRTVSVGVWLHVGSMMELPDENGLSHLMEHMVFKGTEKRTTRQIAEEMDAVGGQLNAFTGKDCTCFYAKVIDEDLELALDMLSDMTISATLDSAELEKERGVVLEEIAMDEDSPEDLVTDLLAATQFAGQSLGMPILGPASQVSAYTRDDLLAFRAKHYCPGETVVAVAGSYDPEKLRELCERYFGSWSSASALLAVPPQRVLSAGVSRRVKDTEQTHLCLGFPGTAYGSPDVYAQAVLNNVLGGAMSSRLFQRIREELGMAYTIYSYPSSYQGCGTFGVYAGVSPRNAERVLGEIRAELARLLEGGITAKEFRDGRQMLRSGYLMGLESSGSRMQAMGRSLLLLGTQQTPEETVARIDSVNEDAVMAAAARILTNDPCIALVGPNADKIAL